MRSRIILLVSVTVMVNTVVFADSAKHSFSLQQDGKPVLVSKANSIMPKIIKACPGLDRYAVDLSPAVISTGQSVDDAYDNGMIMEFVVADKPTVLPKPLNVYSMKNHCSIFVSKKEDKIFIAKRACHSICDGVWKENDPGALGKEYNLN